MLASELALHVYFALLLHFHGCQCCSLMLLAVLYSLLRAVQNQHVDVGIHLATLHSTVTWLITQLWQACNNSWQDSWGRGPHEPGQILLLLISC
jgi:hypothetical protein